MTGSKPITRPGLSKTRLPLVDIAKVTRVRSVDARWRALFEHADAVSEGSVQHDAGGDVWYGTTSLILVYPEAASAAERAIFAGLAACDVHVRLRALRVARREAATRAPGRLGSCTCEIRFVPFVGGVRIDVDVQAPLIVGRHSGTGDR